MILAALALAASVTSFDFKPVKPSSIVFAVANDGSVRITADGKPINCQQFNDYLAKMWKGHPGRAPNFDCKTDEWRNLPKQ